MTREIEKYLNMVKHDGLFLGDVPKDMQTDEVIDTAMNVYYFSFMLIKDDKKKTFKRCVKAVKGHCGLLEYVPKEMQTEEIIDLAMGMNVWVFEYIKDDRKKTYERCLNAVRDNLWLIYYVPDELKERVKNELGLDI